MAIRIDAFVLDLESLRTYLERSLVEVFNDFSRTFTNVGSVFDVIDSETRKRYTLAEPNVIVVYAPEMPQTRLNNPRHWQSDPFLQINLAEYLKLSRCEMTPLFVLRMLCHLPDQKVRLLSRGHGRWWIGSVLVAATRPAIGNEVREDLNALLGRVLGRWNCGFEFTKMDIPEPNSFPIASIEDDVHLAVFTPAEHRRLVRALETIKLATPKFEKPPSYHAFAEDLGGWDEDVRERIEEIVSSGPLVSAGNRLVTFIQ